MKIRARRPWLMLLIAVLSACGGSGTAPRTTPKLLLTAGNGGTDTVGTTLPQALNVQIVSGARAGQVIQFVAVNYLGNPSDFEAYVQPLSSNQSATFIVDTTDLLGRASVVVVLGSHAGAAHVLVRVPQLGLVDTAQFTVRPGHAVALHVTPHDTAVYNGSSVTLTAVTSDRFGNIRPDTAALRVASGLATVSGSSVSGTAIGLARIIASAGPLADTASVTVVPHGTIAAGVSGAPIAVVNLDGSNRHQIGSAASGFLKWAPSGQALAFDQTGGCEGLGSGLPLLTTTLSGVVTTVDADPNLLHTDQYPAYSRDGAWIYFSREGSGYGVLWRAHPDGTASDSLINQNPGIDFAPSVSNDGLRLAYLGRDNTGTAHLRVLTLATGAVTDLGISAWYPQWSPTTTTIAYLQAPCPAPIKLIQADGGGARVLTTTNYNAGFDWSPDGAYLVAPNAQTGLIDLIDATTGVTLPLPFTAGMYSPTWLPTASPAMAAPAVAATRARRRGR